MREEMELLRDNNALLAGIHELLERLVVLIEDGAIEFELDDEPEHKA